MKMRGFLCGNEGGAAGWIGELVSYLTSDVPF